MRKDIAKVLCTRPRIHGDEGRKGRQPRSLEDLPHKESMREKHVRNFNGKQLNEYLSPLRRFINGTVGRNWNDVYSEIREMIKPGNTVMEHIMEHVDHYIAIKVVPDPSSPTGMASHNALGSGFKGYRAKVYPGDLYVDPVTNVVRRAKKHKTPKKVVPITKMLFKDRVVWKQEGVWYRADLVPFTKIVKEVPSYWEPSKTMQQTFYVVDGRYQGRLTDAAILAELQRDNSAYRYVPVERMRKILLGSDSLTAIRKRQLSKAELKAYKVSNDAK